MSHRQSSPGCFSRTSVDILMMISGRNDAGMGTHLLTAARVADFFAECVRVGLAEVGTLESVEQCSCPVKPGGAAEGLWPRRMRALDLPEYGL